LRLRGRLDLCVNRVLQRLVRGLGDADRRSSHQAQHRPPPERSKKSPSPGNASARPGCVSHLPTACTQTQGARTQENISAGSSSGTRKHLSNHRRRRLHGTAYRVGVTRHKGHRKRVADLARGALQWRRKISFLGSPARDRQYAVEEAPNSGYGSSRPRRSLKGQRGVARLMPHDTLLRGTAHFTNSVADGPHRMFPAGADRDRATPGR
jgi:hypothetical protein